VADTGEVSRTIVLEVLSNNGVKVTPKKGDRSGMLVLEKGGRIEDRRIPERVGRRLLQYFQRQFDIPIHHFYNPGMSQPPHTDKIQ